MIENSKLSLTGLHQLIILLSKTTSLQDDKKELANSLLSRMNSSNGKTTEGVSCSVRAFLVQEDDDGTYLLSFKRVRNDLGIGIAFLYYNFRQQQDQRLIDLFLSLLKQFS